MVAAFANWPQLNIFTPQGSFETRLPYNDVVTLLQEELAQASAEDTESKDWPKTKQVSAKAMARLSMAQNAIDFTKRSIKQAGNQRPALDDTNFNSYYRMKVARGNQYWKVDKDVRDLIRKDPDAFKAAKAQKARGGNCGEHAQIAFQFLRSKYKGETIHLASHSMDHAFALIGKLYDINTKEMAVADAWPTHGKAVLWDDFFAYDDMPFDKVTLRNSMVADGKNTAETIAAGISLNARGRRMISREHSEERSDKKIEQGEGRWVWDQPDTYRDSPINYELNEQEE